MSFYFNYVSNYEFYQVGVVLHHSSTALTVIIIQLIFSVADETLYEIVMVKIMGSLLVIPSFLMVVYALPLDFVCLMAIF
jgi:hypothetical protein